MTCGLSRVLGALSLTPRPMKQHFHQWLMSHMGQKAAYRSGRRMSALSSGAGGSGLFVVAARAALSFAYVLDLPMLSPC
jgi:hypothetical protein